MPHLRLVLALALAACGDDLADEERRGDAPGNGADAAAPDAPPAPVAAILSVFWGADNAVALPNSPLQCPGLVGPRDGMPIVMSAEVAPDDLLGSAISVELADGSANPVDCAKREPAGEENEDRTILLIGDLGSPENPPVAIHIVASLPLEDGSDALGAESTAIVGLDAGPSLVVAERVSAAEAEYGEPDDCPGAAAQIVRTIWNGGVDGDNGQELTSDELTQWTVEVDAGGGTRADVTPMAFGDLNDGDNNVDLCLADARTALAVRVVAHAVTDPTNDWNLAQEIAVTAD